MLNLPLDPRTAAFDAVCQRLRTDAILSRIFRRIDVAPVDFRPPTASELPALLIGLKPGGINVVTPNSHTATMIIGLDYFIPGTDWRDIINLYGAIETALDPFGNLSWLQDPVKATGRANVQSIPQFTVQGYSTVPMPEFNALGASCQFQFSLKITTCR